MNSLIHVRVRLERVKRYLTKDMSSGRYVDEWKLVIPENIYNMKKWGDGKVREDVREIFKYTMQI